MKKILFNLSGSIACFKACQVISSLVKKGYEVQATATDSALRFVGPATLEGLTGRALARDLFAPGRAMDHIQLDRWADLQILCPATANSLNKLSLGLGEDLMGALFLAHDFNKPYLIAPAMNATMMSHPTVQNSIERLQKMGVQILDTGEGLLACGEQGYGRLLEPEAIVAAIDGALNFSKKNNLRVLITSGGTSESLDSVRRLTNFSTGATGAELANHFSLRGHQVTLLKAEGAKMPSVLPHSVKTFVSFADYQQALFAEIQKTPFDLMILTAAISDYSIDRIEGDGRLIQGKENEAKLSSDFSQLNLHLSRNPKLINEVKGKSIHPSSIIVGFKLTVNASAEEQQRAVKQVLSGGGVDLVVHNDLSAVLEQTTHRASIYRNGEPVRVTHSKSELGQALEDYAIELIRQRLTPGGT